MMAATLSLLCRCMISELASTTAKSRSRTAERMRILTRTVIVRPRYAPPAALSKTARALGALVPQPPIVPDRDAPDHERHRGQKRGGQRLAQGEVAVTMLMIGTPRSPSEVVTAGNRRLATATAQYASAVPGTAA